jgi:hypothetical protein
MNITMELIVDQIDYSIEQAESFAKKEITSEEFIKVVDDLKALLRKGIRAGLRCNESRIQQKFARFEQIVKPLM